MSRKRDTKQFRQACREVRLNDEERFTARDALHAEKQSSGERGHMSYSDLLAWLRQWKSSYGN